MDPIARRVDDRPRPYELRALAALARDARVDPERLCAVRFGCFLNEINRAELAELVHEVNHRLARMPPEERGPR